MFRGTCSQKKASAGVRMAWPRRSDMVAGSYDQSTYRRTDLQRRRAPAILGSPVPIEENKHSYSPAMGQTRLNRVSRDRPFRQDTASRCRFVTTPGPGPGWMERHHGSASETLVCRGTPAQVEEWTQVQTEDCVIGSLRGSWAESRGRTRPAGGAGACRGLGS